MKNYYPIALVLSLFCIHLHAQDLPEGFPDTERQKTCVNAHWQFHLGDPEADYFAAGFDDSEWKDVSLPHTLELTSLGLNGYTDTKMQETFQREVGWYRKSIQVGDNPNKKVFLEFEGAHQVTDLWVNGQHVGQHSVGGYTPFHFDISANVNYGSGNQITVLVDNRVSLDIPPDPGPFDYIKFSGLYRDVYLVETDPVHLTFNWESMDAGVTITTPTVDPVNMNATINIKTQVRNESEETRKIKLVTRLIDADGLVVLKLTESSDIDPGRDLVFNQIGGIEDNLRLWSIEDPYLYRVNTLVLNGEKAVDVLENRCGFRKVELTHEQGLLLNGKPVKLIGTNRHQHYGYIGDALPNALHYKDVKQIKDLGMNVLRTAHYPHDNAILDACDELGLLAYEEAPTWIDIGGETWFDNLEQAARVMVRNHKNHPSIIIWGAGINHRGYVPRMHYAVKQEDPTRLTASQGSRWTGWQSSGLTDIYAQMVYGPYYWSEEEYMLAMEGGRGPEAVNAYLDHPMKLGLISWTAHAYYTFHPNKNPKDRTRSGMMTVFRYPRPGLMWYKAEMLEEPYIHIRDQWIASRQKMNIYSNADEVEVLVNGKSMERLTPSQAENHINLKHAPFIFEVKEFEEGEFKVNGITDGVVVVSETILTPGKPHHIELETDMEDRVFTADGSDILVVYACVVDKNGTNVQDEDIKIEFEVEGSALIVGDKEEIGSNPMGLTYGVAPALIQAGHTPGQVVIKASAKGLKSATSSVETVAAEANVVAREALAIYDFEEVRVDLGEHTQLPQYDWIVWNESDNSASEKSFEELGGFSAEIKGATDNTLVRWLGEINVMGKYGYAFGDGLICMDMDGLVLQFNGLKKGSYKLVTSHHAPRSNTDSMDPNQESQATANVFKLPYTNSVDIRVEDASGSVQEKSTAVTFGKAMHTEPFGSAELILESDGENPVKVIFKDTNGEKGVWLNAFTLSQWFDN